MINDIKSLEVLPIKFNYITKELMGGGIARLNAAIKLRIQIPIVDQLNRTWLINFKKKELYLKNA